MPLKVASWNVNSLRARHAHLLEWLREASPDVVCLQETKITDDEFPAWEITDAIIADSDPDPLARALRFDELFYRLRRM